MVDLWLHDIESLEAVTQDERTKRLCLRMAAMSQAGTLAPFIATLRHDQELDEGTKGTIAEIAGNANFLLALGGLRPSHAAPALGTTRPHTPRFGRAVPHSRCRP